MLVMIFSFLFVQKSWEPHGRLNRQDLSSWNKETLNGFAIQNAPESWPDSVLDYVRYWIMFSEVGNANWWSKRLFDLISG